MLEKIAEKLSEALVGIVRTTGKITGEAVNVIKTTLKSALEGVEDIGGKSFEDRKSVV